MKYHGLGNDFLVLVDRERAVELDAPLARALCDRHRGLGADGLLRLSMTGVDDRVAMELWNADGSVAETSGNGLRCAALAAVHEELAGPGSFTVVTAAGASRVEVAHSGAPGTDVRVEMGPVRVGPELAAAGLPLAPGATRAERDALAALGDRGARRVEVGNPHLVIMSKEPVEPGRPGSASAEPSDVALLGSALEQAVPGGVNVEVVAPLGEDNALSMDVWERGAGITLACGTGSCAAAAAARASGIVGDAVSIRNPGGTLTVELSGDPLAPSAVLTGPARRVGRSTVDTAELDR